MLISALTIAACTSDDAPETQDFATGDESTSDEELAELDFFGRPDDYLVEVAERSTVLFTDLEEAMAPLDAASTPEEAMTTAPTALREALAPLGRAGRDLRSIRPPAEYVADHRLLVLWLEDEAAIRADQLQAAESSDLEAFADLEQRSAIFFDRMALDLSPPIAALVVR